MPSLPLSINGVSYTDTVAFLNEVEKVINRDVDAIINKINDYVSLVAEGDDEYEKFVFTAPVRSDKVDFCCRNRCDSGGHKSKWKPFVSKRKAVK